MFLPVFLKDHASNEERRSHGKHEESSFLAVVVFAVGLAGCGEEDKKDLQELHVFRVGSEVNMVIVLKENDDHRVDLLNFTEEDDVEVRIEDVRAARWFSSDCSVRSSSSTRLRCFERSASVIRSDRHVIIELKRMALADFGQLRIRVGQIDGYKLDPRLVRVITDADTTASFQGEEFEYFNEFFNPRDDFPPSF